MNDLKINNGVDELTTAEQKTILSAQTYFLVCENALFNCVLLRGNNIKIVWTPDDIDAAIVYLKKNNIIQTFN